jgi:hypothetical protein
MVLASEGLEMAFKDIPREDREMAEERTSGSPKTTGRQRPQRLLSARALIIMSGPTPAGSPMVIPIKGRTLKSASRNNLNFLLFLLYKLLSIKFHIQTL